MILGYEQPVDIPVMSMYDKDMMKMYLGALREDYQQGIKDQEEFNKMASEFTSPISKDNERWYNITTKPILDFLNQNPDAIRTVEGRSKIRQFINSRPYGEMANLRQSAANAKLFDAARQKMIADGTYSDDMAKFFNEDFSNWSTVDNGVWGKVAPTKYIGMEDALLPTIQMLQKSYRLDEEASKKRPGYNVFNVSEQQARDAINRNYVDLMKMPSMQYHFAKSGLTEEQFKDLLTRQALSQTPEKLEADQWAMLQAKIAAEAAENAKDRALKRSLANSSEDTPYVPQSLHQQSETASTSQRSIYMGGGSNGGNPQNFQNRLQEIHNYWLGRKNSSAYNKSKKAIDAMIKWSGRVLKDGFGKAVKNGLLQQNQYGDYEPTADFERIYSKVKLNTMTTKPKYGEAVQNAVSWRSINMTPMQDDFARNALANKFTGTSTISGSITSGDGIKNREVYLGSSDMIFTPHRALQLAGNYRKGRSFRDTKSSIAEKFNTFVHSDQLTGWFTNASYSQMKQGSVPRANGGVSFEVDAPVLISKSDFHKFAKTSGYEDVDDLVKDLGLKLVTKQGKVVSNSGKTKGKLNWSDTEYIQAPFTRIQNNNNTFYNAADDYTYDKSRYGAASATKYNPSREARSVGKK